MGTGAHVVCVEDEDDSVVGEMVDMLLVVVGPFEVDTDDNVDVLIVPILGDERIEVVVVLPLGGLSKELEVNVNVNCEVVLVVTMFDAELVLSPFRRLNELIDDESKFEELVRPPDKMLVAERTGDEADEINTLDVGEVSVSMILVTVLLEEKTSGLVVARLVEIDVVLSVTLVRESCDCVEGDCVPPIERLLVDMVSEVMVVEAVSPVPWFPVMALVVSELPRIDEMLVPVPEIDVLRRDVVAPDVVAPDQVNEVPVETMIGGDAVAGFDDIEVVLIAPPLPPCGPVKLLNDGESDVSVNKLRDMLEVVDVGKKSVTMVCTNEGEGPTSTWIEVDAETAVDPVLVA